MLGFAAIDLQRLSEVARGPIERAFGVFEKAEGGLSRNGWKRVETLTQALIVTLVVLAGERHLATLS